MKVEEFIKSKNNGYKKYILSLTNRILVTAIIILSLLILCNIKKDFKDSIEKYVYKTNYNFAKINSLYKKYLLSLKKETSKVSELVSNNKTLDYTDKKSFLDGVLLNVGENYPVRSLDSGIIVYIGKKDDMNSIIMQQSNGLDVIYGNISESDVKLYDYIEKNTILGNTDKDELYLSFQKNNEVLNYEPYIEN